MVASHRLHPGAWPPTQACALTGRGTSTFLVYRTTPNQLTYTSQGCNSFKIFYLLIDLREREREGATDINLLFHLFMHSLVDLVCALTRNGTCNLGRWGQCSNQQSYLARASGIFFFSRILIWNFSSIST